MGVKEIITAVISILLLLFPSTVEPQAGGGAKPGGAKPAGGGGGGTFDVVAQFGAKADEKTDLSPVIKHKTNFILFVSGEIYRF